MQGAEKGFKVRENGLYNRISQYLGEKSTNRAYIKNPPVKLSLII